MRTLFKISSIAVLMLLTASCATSNNPTYRDETNSELAPNSQSQYAREQYSAVQSTIIELRRQNVQVIQVGNTLTVIMPVDAFFKPQSNQLNSANIPSLNLVADLLRAYGNVAITIAGNTDNIGSIQEKSDRSYQQAHTIASYLWNAGIPLRNMKVMGYSDNNPVANNRTPSGSAANRRIEITIND